MSLWVQMSLSLDRAMNKPCNFPESESEINIMIKRKWQNGDKFASPGKKNEDREMNAYINLITTSINYRFMA
jgi:hypothetical protein